MFVASVNATRRSALVTMLALSLAAMSALSSTLSIAANPKPILQAVMKLVAVVSAAELAKESTVSVQDYFADTARPGESIYSASFKFDRSSWADFWSKPDVFMVVECEGGKRLIIPEIEFDWNYGPKIFTFRCPTLAAGSHCVLRLYDDDSASNEVWKNILATRVSWTGKGNAKASSLPVGGVVAINADVSANGQLQLLTPNQTQKLVLDAPDPIATIEFVVPRSLPLSRWEMAGDFVQGGTDFGKVRLTHWFTNPLPSITGYLLKPMVVFWAVVLIGVVVLLLGYYSTKAQHLASK